MLQEVEMPETPSFNIEEGIQRLRAVGMLEWVYFVCHCHPASPLFAERA